MVQFIAGLFLGAILVLFVEALCVVASEEREQSDLEYELWKRRMERLAKERGDED